MQTEHLQYLTNISKYLRIEPLLATLLIDELGTNDRLHFELQSTFRRPIDGEVASIASSERASGKGHDIVLKLNRDGIYDSLPEGLFYLSEREVGKNISADDLKAAQQAETDARIFFEPIEQAWMHLRLRSALDEERFDFFRIDQQFVSFFSDFWQLPARLDADLLKKLLLVLPRLHEVAGNDAQIIEILQFCLSEYLVPPDTVLNEDEAEEYYGSNMPVQNEAFLPNTFEMSDEIFVIQIDTADTIPIPNDDDDFFGLNDRTNGAILLRKNSKTTELIPLDFIANLGQTALGIDAYIGSHVEVLLPDYHFYFKIKETSAPSNFLPNSLLDNTIRLLCNYLIPTEIDFKLFYQFKTPSLLNHHETYLGYSSNL